MSFANTLKAAAAEAQRVLAPMCDPAGAGAFTLSSHSGETFTGVIEEQDELDPLDPAGIRRQRHLFILATQAQFDPAPAAAPRCIVTARGANWAVQSVTPQAHHFRLTCRPL